MSRKKKIMAGLITALVMIVVIGVGVIGLILGEVELEERKMEIRESQALIYVGMRLDQLNKGSIDHYPERDICNQETYRDTCDFFKDLTGSHPTIHTDGQDGCVFIEIDENAFFCLSSKQGFDIDPDAPEKLRDHLTDLNPEEHNICTSNNFNCPE